MGQKPLRAAAAEAAMTGAPRDGVRQAAEKADEGTDPPDDTWASADFRRHLVRVLTGRAVEERFLRVDVPRGGGRPSGPRRVMPVPGCPPPANVAAACERASL